MKRSLLAFITDVRELLISAWWHHLWPSQPLFLLTRCPVAWRLPVTLTAVISWLTPILSWRSIPQSHVSPSPPPITLPLRTAQTFSLLTLQFLGPLPFLPLLCHQLRFPPGWPDSHKLSVQPWPQASPSHPRTVHQLQGTFQHVVQQFLVTQVGEKWPLTKLGVTEVTDINL